MSISRSFKLLQVFFVISMALVSITSLTTKGYCDDYWVYVTRNELFTQYYNSSSVKIDKQNKIIQVWIKVVYTTKGKSDYLEKLKKINLFRDDYFDFKEDLTLMLYNYNEMKNYIKQITYYSASGSVIDSLKGRNKWNDILPGSIGETTLNKLLEDYNIKR